MSNFSSLLFTNFASQNKPFTSHIFCLLFFVRGFFGTQKVILSIQGYSPSSFGVLLIKTLYHETSPHAKHSYCAKWPILNSPSILETYFKAYCVLFGVMRIFRRISYNGQSQIRRKIRWQIRQNEIRRKIRLQNWRTKVISSIFCKVAQIWEMTAFQFYRIWMQKMLIFLFWFSWV